MAGSTSSLMKPGLVRKLLSQARLAIRLIREPAVPLVTRAIPVLAVLYLISPLDFIPDIIPALGQLDDLGILVLALELFLKLCPTDTKTFHEAAMAQGRVFSPMPPAAGDVIDAEWHA